MVDEEQLGEDKDNGDVIINTIQLKPQHVNSNQTILISLGSLISFTHTKHVLLSQSSRLQKEEVFTNNGHV
jgi:hypothetical protein